MTDEESKKFAVSLAARRKNLEKNMQKKSDLFVMTKTKDLAKYIITVTEKSPKKFRFTLVVRLQNYILDAIESIYLANSSFNKTERLEYQRRARTQLSMLDYFAGLAYEQECILPKQYEQISKQVAECLLYLGKWIASTQKTVSPAENNGGEI